MLDLSLFRIRIYWAAAAAAFLNGLSRFALMFLFVFYFQGPQRDDPITAGIKLIPLAAGMLGRLADRRLVGRPPRLARHGRRRDADQRRRPRRDDDAAGGDAVLGAGTWLAIVGVGSGMFNSPNTAAMMAAVPPWRRGIAAGTRTMLQNTGAVISIALMLMIVTAVVPKLLFSIFSGLTTGLSEEKARPVHAGHAHRPVGPGRLLARRRRSSPADPPRR